MVSADLFRPVLINFWLPNIGRKSTRLKNLILSLSFSIGITIQVIHDFENEI